MAALQTPQSNHWTRSLSLLGGLIWIKLVLLCEKEIHWSLWTPFALFWQDMLVVLIFGLLDRLVRANWYGWTAYLVAGAYCAINLPVGLLFSTPLTWPMIQAVGPALSDSIQHHLDPKNSALLLITLLLLALLPFLTARIKRPHWVVWWATGLFIGLGPTASRHAETNGLERNAIACLFLSARSPVSGQYSDRDWRRSPIYPRQESESLEALSGLARQRHVFLIILESTGAEYLNFYGASKDPTPHLSQLARHAIVFENAHAVYPESIKGLFATLCSRYPALNTPADAYASNPTKALPQALFEAGYQTSLFHSGRFMYLGMRSIIENRGYQVLEDAGHIGGNHESSFGVDEFSTVERILEWIDARESSDPFFVTYLPVAGHHPYATPKPGPFLEEDESDRYRNALHYGDQALGGLLRGLADRDLMEQSLFFIIGDHGEAFGQHPDNFGHTLHIYEENLRVPCLIAAPGLITDPIRIARPVSLLDVAPTILDLAGLPIPSDFQGISMLAPAWSMSLFFTDYAFPLVGLRDREWKFILNLETGRPKLFNLAEDPQETVNRAFEFPSQCELYKQHLEKWSAAQSYRLAQRPRS